MGLGFYFIIFFFNSTRVLDEPCALDISRLLPQLMKRLFFSVERFTSNPGKAKLNGPTRRLFCSLGI